MRTAISRALIAMALGVGAYVAIPSTITFQHLPLGEDMALWDAPIGQLPLSALERCQQLQDEIIEETVIGLDARGLPVELLDNVLDLCNGREWQ